MYPFSLGNNYCCCSDHSEFTPSVSAPVAKTITPSGEYTVSSVDQLGVLKLAKLTHCLVRIAYTSKEAQTRLEDLQPWTVWMFFMSAPARRYRQTNSIA